MAKAAVIVPLAIVGTLALGVGALYLSVLDRTPCPYSPNEMSNDQLIKRQLVRSLAKAKDEKKIEYKFDQDCLNQVLSNASTDIKKGLGENAGLIGSIYTEIHDGNNYKFYIEAKLPILTSRIILDTTLSSDDNNYYFNLNEVNAGHLPVGWAVNTFNVMDKLPLKDALKQTGLTMSVDHDNHRLIYKKADMEADLFKMMTSDADEMLKGAIETIPLTFSFKNGITATGDLSKLVDNSAFADSSLDGEHYANYDAALSVIQKGVDGTVSLLRDGGNEQAAEEWAQEYFEHGLQNLLIKGQEANEVMKSRLLEVDVSEYAAEHYDKKVSYFTERELNSILATTGIVGKSYIFNYEDEIAYVVVDRFFSDIYVDDGTGDAYLNFTIGVNINGLETRATIQTVCIPVDNSFQTSFKIKEVYFGELVAPESFSTMCKNLFSDALDSMKDRSWIEHEKGSDTMTLNFDKLLAEDSALEEYNEAFSMLGGIRRFVIDGSSLTDNGELALWYQK